MTIPLAFCVEIFVPSTGGVPVEGSGFTLAPEWVLTAYHVLFGDDVDIRDETKISIAWREAPATVDAEPVSAAVARNNIVWYDESLDLALIRCPLPDLGVKPPLASMLLARHIPEDSDTKWESFGYLSAFGDAQGDRDSQNPAGILGSVNRHKPSGKLKVTSGAMEHQEAWAGFSGSPVFCGNRLLAVVVEANPGRRGESLSVSFLPQALETEAGAHEKSFAEFLGIDPEKEIAEERGKLHAWFVKSFVRRFQQTDDVLLDMAMDAFHRTNPDREAGDPEALARALLVASPEQAVAFVEDLHAQVRDQPSPAHLAVLNKLATLMLCLVFPNQVAVTKVNVQRNKGVSIIDSDTAKPMDTEVALAAADRQTPAIQYYGDRSRYPYNASPKPQRCGLSESYKTAARDIATCICGKEVPGNYEKVVEQIWDQTYRGRAAGDMVAALERKEEKREALARSSARSPRRFYVLLPHDASEEGRQEWLPLKRAFERLDLINPKPHPDLDATTLIDALEIVIRETHTQSAGDQND